MRSIFTKEEIETLKANKNVLKCSPKQITFTEEFKTEAIKKYLEGLPPSQVFREADIDIDLMGKENPKRCLQTWRKQFQAKGNLKDTRGRSGKGGRKPKEKIPEDRKERMKYLEAKVAYLEKENSFLAKLRAKRAEK